MTVSNAADVAESAAKVTLMWRNVSERIENLASDVYNYRVLVGELVNTAGAIALREYARTGDFGPLRRVLLTVGPGDVDGEDEWFGPLWSIFKAAGETTVTEDKEGPLRVLTEAGSELYDRVIEEMRS